MFMLLWVHQIKMLTTTSHENVCNDHDCCLSVMSVQEKTILKYNQDKNSLKTSFVIYAGTELLLEKIHQCDNNLPCKKFSTAKISKHTACSIHYSHTLHLIVVDKSYGQI